MLAGVKISVSEYSVAFESVNYTVLSEPSSPGGALAAAAPPAR